MQFLQLLQYGEGGRLVDTLAVLPYGRRGFVDAEARMMASPMFESMGTFAVDGDRVHLSDGAEPEVRTVSHEGRLRRVLRWETEERRVVEADVERFQAEQLDGLEGGWRRVVERRNDAVPVNSEFPAVTVLMVAENGELWVREYPRPGLEEVRWLRFDRGGRFVCELPVNRDVRVYGFGDNHILTRRVDALGIETLEMSQVTQN